MKKQNKKIISVFFLVVLMFGLVSAAADNTSVMYGQNDSGSQVPIAVDSTGRLKLNLNLLNITAGSIAASGNLSLGEIITFNLGETIDNIVDNWVRVTGNLNITGNMSLGGKTLRNNNGTLTWGNFSINNPVPENAVMSFNQASCPIGWTLADGTNGTPDLRGIFIRGAGTSGVIDYANGTDMSATYGQYYNDSLQYFQIAGTISGTTYYGGLESPNYEASGQAGNDHAVPKFHSTYQGNANQITAVSNGSATGTPRTGAETAPASYAMIYCVKGAEDSPSSNSIWQTLGNIILPVNSSKDFAINNSNFYVNVTSGNVGIGASSPKATLEVDGTMRSVGSATPVSGAGLEFLYSGTSGGITSYNRTASAYTDLSINDLIYLTGNSNVGIGVSNPVTGKLEISNPNTASNYNALYIENNEVDNWGLNIGGSSPSGIALGSDADNNCYDQGGTSLCSINADYAELMYSRETNLEDGDVMVINSDETFEGAEFIKSTRPYDKLVGGVYSEVPAMVISPEGTYIKGWKSENENAFPLALSGRKHIKVSNENGIVEKGDLLVTSSERGKAMKCDMEDYLTKCVGAILGKAMTDEQDGKVLALITLQ